MEPSSAATLPELRRRSTAASRRYTTGSMTLQIGASLITLAPGDITEQHVDAIVNAANTTLLGGGGVDGAIHRRGGPTILDECRQIRQGAYATGLPVGEAGATTAGKLPARWVVHTVGPGWSASQDRSDPPAALHPNSPAGADG